MTAKNCFLLFAIAVVFSQRLETKLLEMLLLEIATQKVLESNYLLTGS